MRWSVNTDIKILYRLPLWLKRYSHISRDSQTCNTYLSQSLWSLGTADQVKVWKNLCWFQILLFTRYHIKSDKKLHGMPPRNSQEVSAIFKKWNASSYIWVMDLLLWGTCGLHAYNWTAMYNGISWCKLYFSCKKKYLAIYSLCCSVHLLNYANGLSSFYLIQYYCDN
jgi:hypothetical protein